MAKTIEGTWYYDDGSPVLIPDCIVAMDVALLSVKDGLDQAIKEYPGTDFSGVSRHIETLETIRARFAAACLIIPGNGGKFRM